MAVYVMSDIHGQYDMFMDLMEQINLKAKDKLYILGDVIDRGTESMKVLFEMMKHPNILPLIGNHELMAIKCLKYLHEKKMGHEKPYTYDLSLDFIEWEYNGAAPTIEEFEKLSTEEQEQVLNYMYGFSPYKTVTVKGKKYILVHAGLGNFSEDKKLSDYTLNELVWERPDFTKGYSCDATVVLGHTPTQFIDGFEHPGMIFKGNNLINIDCGAGGRKNLGAIRLDDGKEFYSKSMN